MSYYQDLIFKHTKDFQGWVPGPDYVEPDMMGSNWSCDCKPTECDRVYIGGTITALNVSGGGFVIPSQWEPGIRHCRTPQVVYPGLIPMARPIAYPIKNRKRFFGRFVRGM